MYRRIVLILLMGVVAAGCTTTQSVPVDERSRTFDAPRRAVLESVVQMFTAEGYPVDYVDRDVGLISTGYKYERRFLAERRVRANAYVDEIRGGHTRVTVLLSVEDVGEHGQISAEPLLGSTARKMYRELLDEIGARL